MFISDTFSNFQQRIFYSILNGVYPSEKVHRMNSFQLKQFVSSLLLHTANVVGANNPAKRKKNYILWLTNKHEIGKNMTTSNRILNLQVIMNIVNFFQQNPLIQKSINVDQFLYSKKEIPVRRKRKPLRYNNAAQSEKRIKIVGENAMVALTTKKQPELVVRLSDVLKYGNSYDKECFMKYFSLKKKNPNIDIDDPVVKLYRNESHNIKLFNCPKIPITSDLGRKLINKEKVCLNEETKLNRISRTEWYLSQPVKKLPDVDYLVTYKPKQPTNTVENKCVLAPKVDSFKMCRPLTVSLVNLKETKLNNSSKTIISKPKRTIVGKKLLNRTKIEILNGKRKLKVCLNRI